MSYRIHTANLTYLTVHYVEKPEDYFGDDEMATGPSLILDDSGNQEAFVIPGDPEAIAAIARLILDILPVKLTTEEQNNLAHFCDMYDYDPDRGSVSREYDGTALFWSDEDGTGYDLTNGRRLV
jgi:hypothetical protein